jgi:hypothetical protein
MDWPHFEKNGSAPFLYSVAPAGPAGIARVSASVTPPAAARTPACIEEPPPGHTGARWSITTN